MESFRKNIVAGTVTLMAFAGLAFCTGGALAAGLDDTIVGGISYMVALIALGFVVLIGAILWGSRTPKVQGYGKLLTLVPMVGVFILVIGMAIQPAAVPVVEDQAEFEVLAVNTTHANYTASSQTAVAVIRVDTTGANISTPANHIFLNFTVQRVDAGSAIDIKTIACSYSPATVTDATTGLSYSVARPFTDGRPNVNWSLNGEAAAVRTLSAQQGLTPYESNYISLNIEWNPAAFTVTQVAANDVFDAGTVTIGPETYNLQVLIRAITW